MSSAAGSSFLVVRIGSRACALRLSDVVETMRPLPVIDVPAAPSFVLGATVVRGAPAPVLDLAPALGEAGGTYGRFVTLRAADRVVVLAVASVVGVRELGAAELAQAPPLFGAGLASVVDEMGALDAEVVFVLSAARLVPDAPPRADP